VKMARTNMLQISQTNTLTLAVASIECLSG